MRPQEMFIKNIYCLVVVALSWKDNIIDKDTILLSSSFKQPEVCVIIPRAIWQLAHMTSSPTVS
jgi:hypothetical protein